MAVLVSSIGKARADAPSCADPRVTIEGQIDPRFSDSIRRMCDQLTTLPNVDPTASLRLSAVGSDLLVEATLADGRSTLRRVRLPDELPLTVEALLALPPPVTTATPSAAVPEPRSQPVQTPVAKPSLPAHRTAPAMPSAAGAAPIAVELGAELGGRASGSPLYLAVSPRLFAGVRVDRWMFALLARWDAFESVTKQGYPSFEMNGLGAGFLVAPRVFRSGAFQLDVGLATIFLTEEQGTSEGTGERSGTSADLRLALVTRAMVGKGKLRGLFSFDTELSPLRLRRVHRIDPALPPLPSFGAGLAAGFAWVGP